MKLKYSSVFCFVEAEVIKEKAKPVPKKKGLIYCQLSVKSFYKQNVIQILYKYLYIIIIVEAEIIKENVKPAPIKKGMDSVKTSAHIDVLQSQRFLKKRHLNQHQNLQREVLYVFSGNLCVFVYLKTYVSVFKVLL